MNTMEDIISSVFKPVDCSAEAKVASEAKSISVLMLNDRQELKTDSGHEILGVSQFEICSGRGSQIGIIDFEGGAQAVCRIASIKSAYI